MADEVQGSVAGPNGEKLSFQIGNKAIGLTTNNLFNILLLGAMMLGGRGGFLPFFQPQ